uniref:Essential MCU regulator, mitochondrial n=1 Tax=Clastoptera arizonana TaxID=38151 RepID=A0A1B6DFJ6_9HEMI
MLCKMENISIFLYKRKNYLIKHDSGMCLEKRIDKIIQRTPKMFYRNVVSNSHQQREKRRFLIFKPSGALNPEPKRVTFFVLGGAILLIISGTILGVCIGEYMYSLYHKSYDRKRINIKRTVN